MSKEERITILFNRENQQEETILKELQESLKTINAVPYGRTFTPGELLKFCFKRPSQKEMLSMQKARMSNEQKIDRWVVAYNKLHAQNISKYDFIVNILPSIGAKKLKVLDKWTNEEEGEKQ
ncbi:MAG: hypothetical protein HQK53_05670 [Oligoflexia bacterium]|nr:hypothetical protein [Oligoflexia bacterium]